MGYPNALVTIVQLAYVAVVFGLAATIGPRRAVLPGLIGGWLFLPHFDARSAFLGLTSKAMLVPATVFAACVLLDDVRRWRALRLSVADLAVAVVSLVPFATALNNALGMKEAIAASLEATLTWGLPYLLARTYLGDAGRLKDYAHALVVGGLLYVPLCLWEIRMSPQLQFDLYGFRAENFTTMVRYGGFRPSVFMQTGLAVGMFMALAALSAYWLWRTRALPSALRSPMGVACALLAVTTLLCKSTGAILLFALGLVFLEILRHGGTLLVVSAGGLIAIAPAYCAVRIAGWDPQGVVELTRTAIDDDRASSLQARFDNERLLIEKAMRRPALGWGRFGRSFVYDEEGQNLGVVVDSMWIIALGFTGIVGLVSLGVLLLWPCLLALHAVGAQRWGDPALAPAGILLTSNLLWTLDDVLNAMMSPVFPAIAGALVSFALTAKATRHLRDTPSPARVPSHEAQRA